MLKAELGMSLQSGVQSATDTQLYRQIELQQRRLASEFSWPFLEASADTAVTAGTAAANRYYTLPVTSVNFERPVTAQTLWGTFWYPVEYGIDECEYNSISSGDGTTTAVQQNPVMRWKYKDGDNTKFEVWPLASTAQTFRFRGQKPLTAIFDATTAALVINSTLDLDDTLVVLFAAAAELSRMKKQDSSLKLAMAEQHLNRLKASYSSRNEPFVLGQDTGSVDRRTIKLVTVA